MRSVEITDPGKVVITTTKALAVEWHKAEFARMTDEFRRVRSPFKEKLNRCFICNWPFQVGTNETGEVMNIVCFKFEGNKLLCTYCYKKLTGDL